MNDSNYYEFLGISQTASPYDIRKAYKLKAIKQFLFLQKIKDVLLDPEARKTYDKVLELKKYTKRRMEEMAVDRKQKIDELMKKEKEYKEEEEIKKRFEVQRKRVEGDRIARMVGKWFNKRSNKIPNATKRSVRLFWSASVPTGYYNTEFIRKKVSIFGDVVGVWLNGRNCFVVFKNEDSVRKLEMSHERGHLIGDDIEVIDMELMTEVITTEKNKKTQLPFSEYEELVLNKLLNNKTNENVERNEVIDLCSPQKMEEIVID
ncbi:DnaJ domain containing protein [Entamoeba marina]